MTRHVHLCLTAIPLLVVGITLSACSSSGSSDPSAAANTTLSVTVTDCPGPAGVPISVTDQSNTVVGAGTLSASGCQADINVPVESFYTLTFAPGLGTALSQANQSFTEGPYSHSSLAAYNGTLILSCLMMADTDGAFDTSSPTCSAGG
jgi:hypothetical protein